jgi:putative membrane protein
MINRRYALNGLTGLATVSALAAASFGTARAQQAMAPASGKALGGGAYKTQTLMFGTLSKEQSQLALTRASHAKVKQFAQFEVDEQTAVAQTLTDESNPPPAPLDATQREMLVRLQQASGRSFDAAYLQAQIEGHQKLLMIQQEFLSGRPTDTDHEHIAMLARTVIQMHLTMLDDLRRETGAV